MFYFAVEVELDGILIFCGGHDSDVPYLEKFLQVFLINEVNVFKYPGDRCSVINKKVTQLHILPI